MLDEINLLRTLLAVADGGSHSAAAAALGVTASAVSQQLKVLDARLGAPLFERIGRRSVLTTDGRTFVEQIRRPFDELQEAVRQHRERDVGLAGPVRIGAASGFFAAWLRPRLVPLLQDHPALRLEARIGTLGALPALLEEGALDLAMAVGAVDSTALDSAPLYRQRFVLVGTPEQMGTDPRRSAAKLRDAPFIVFDHERFLLRRWWRAVFGAREALPNAAAHHIGNIFELRAFVEAGMGLAVLPLFFARDALA
ncbi:MAG: LysR family transcriptional regulator, partial [Myxococcota bacterium]